LQDNVEFWKNDLKKRGCSPSQVTDIVQQRTQNYIRRWEDLKNPGNQLVN